MKVWKKVLWLWLVALSVNAASEQRQQGPIQLDGYFTQGGMVLGSAPKGSQISLNGAPLRLTDDGRFVFGFGRDEALSHQLGWRSGGQSGQMAITINKREYDIQKVNGVASKYVNPDPSVEARIKEDNRKLAAARKRDEELEYFLQPFIWPAEGRLSGVYGSQRIFNGEPRNPHYGLDLSAPTGSPVYAPAGGVVTLVEPDMYFSGGTLIVDHGHGISSTFIHLSKIEVKEGQRVAQGELIARIGATGRVTGPHLDWRVNWFSTRLDPQLLVPPHPPQKRK